FGPTGADGPVHRVRSGAGRPVDRPTLGEVVVSADTVGCCGLVGDRVPERSGLPAELLPHVVDRTVHLPGAAARRVVDRAALAEVVEAPHPVGGTDLAGGRVAEHAGLPTLFLPLGADRPVDLVCAG